MNSLVYMTKTEWSHYIDLVLLDAPTWMREEYLREQVRRRGGVYFPPLLPLCRHRVNVIMLDDQPCVDKASPKDSKTSYLFEVALFGVGGMISLCKARVFGR